MRYLLEVTKATRGEDLLVDYDNILDAIVAAAQNGFTDDGYRIIAYEPGSGGPLREGSKALVRAYGSAGVTETLHDSLALASVAVAALNGSDGYDLIDLEQPIGSAPSILIERRPALWQRHYAESGYAAQRANGWNRSDSDRF